MGDEGKNTHFLETRRQEKVSKANMGDGGKHALPRDNKARKSEQNEHGRWGKSTHFLEIRTQEKVSRTNMGNGGKAHTS
jgi:hypothetical protein